MNKIVSFCAVLTIAAPTVCPRDRDYHGRGGRGGEKAFFHGVSHGMGVGGEPATRRAFVVAPLVTPASLIDFPPLRGVTFDRDDSVRRIKTLDRSALSRIYDATIKPCFETLRRNVQFQYGRYTAKYGEEGLECLADWLCQNVLVSSYVYVRGEEIRTVAEKLCLAVDQLKGYVKVDGSLVTMAVDISGEEVRGAALFALTHELCTNIGIFEAALEASIRAVTRRK
jgi:hypothetical protein